VFVFFALIQAVMGDKGRPELISGGSATEETVKKTEQWSLGFGSYATVVSTVARVAGDAAEEPGQRGHTDEGLEGGLVLLANIKQA
jgi:hypothetical protein